MKFGIFDRIEGIPGTSMHTLLRDRIDLVKMADAAGFYGYHLAEHHGSDLCQAPSQGDLPRCRCRGDHANPAWSDGKDSPPPPSTAGD